MLETRNFLMPDATFVIELVAFIAVLAVMTRYVVPRIRRAMHERQHSIATALAAAEAADKQRDAARAEAALILAEARAEASAITRQARATRDHLIAEGRKAGTEEYRWLAGRASRELQRRSELSERSLRQQAHTATLAAVKAHLGDDVDVTSVAKLLDEQFEAQTARISAPQKPGRVASSVVAHTASEADVARMRATA